MSSAISDSSTRNRSESVEDTEPSEHERKRPRLSESTAGRDSAAVSDLEMESSQTLSMPAVSADDHEETAPKESPPLPPRTTDSTMVTSPTSKVTINTRPLSSQSIIQPALDVVNDANLDADPPDLSREAGPATAATAAPLALGIPSSQQASDSIGPETISIPSSPTKTPEIEIAEVEDYEDDDDTYNNSNNDDHPSRTRWTVRIGVGSSDRQSILPAHVYRTFPFAHEESAGNTRRIVLRMMDIFQNAGPNDGEIFRQVKNWLTEFVSICDVFSPRLVEEDRDFWIRLPDLVEGLLRREANAPANARTEDLVDFFVVYGRVAKLVMDYDTRLLQTSPDEAEMKILKGSGLLCTTYLQPLMWIMQFRIPFYTALRRSHSFDVAEFLTSLIDNLADPTRVGLMPAMSNLLPELGAALARKPDLFTPFNQILQIVGQMIQPFFLRVSGDLVFRQAAFAHLDSIRDAAADIVMKADAVLQQAIVKQFTWLNIDTGSKLVDQINSLMMTIAVEVPRIGQDIISSAGVGFVDADLTDLPSTMQQAWKFKTLRKFVTSGRMELRVYGIEAMSTDLVGVWNEYINGKVDGTRHALVQFLVKFIQQTQLINYIIGVDSHPQLIQRSANIVGFLCVAGVYTDRDTDTIWRTVLESQDPRTVSEVFLLLQRTFQTYDLPALYYLCQKLVDLPFGRFDPNVLNFTLSLFESIKTKTSFAIMGTRQRADPITRQLCVKLLREANSPDFAHLEQSSLIRRDITQQLKTFLNPRAEPSPLSIDQDEQDAMLNEISNNLRLHNDYACGDVQIMNCILPLLKRDTMLDLVHKTDFTNLLVADIAHLKDQVPAEPTRSLTALELGYEIRTMALFHLIHLVPDTFTADLMDLLWTSLFTAHQLPQSVHTRAWETLTNVMKTKPSKDPNPFLDQIIDEYSQRLRPSDYSKAVLEFIKHSVAYRIRYSAQTLMDSEDIVSIPGVDRVWSIMLEAPPNTVENDATDFIIRQYLDSPLVTRRPKAIIDATHLSLVDRCVQQVIASATRLKSFTDGAVSGEDEPMVIIASEEEIRAEELRFDRSLLFLRRFLEGMKARPRYSPGPTLQPKSLPDFPGKKGDTMEITIQIPASKYVSGTLHRVTVGCDSTGAELWQYLSDVSGYAEPTVFHLGQKMNSLKEETTSLAELKLASGLVLVHKTVDTPEIVPSNSTRAASPVDNKVMHHFDDLYDLLEADGRLSKEVYNFLSLFSAQTEVIRVVRSMTSLPEDLLPPGKPYKLLYCAQALRSCIEDESFSINPDTEFLVYSVHTIVAILPKLEVRGSGDRLHLSIAHGLVEALLLALRAKVPAQVSQSYISDHKEFVTQISRLLACGLQCTEPSSEQLSPQTLVRTAFETCIEACLHDERMWDHLDSNADFQSLLATAFVDDPRYEVRHSLPEVVVGLTGGGGTKLNLKFNDPRAPRSRFPSTVIESCLSHLWTCLVGSLSRACQHPEKCQAMFEAMLAILRRIGKSFSADTVRQGFDQWTELLLHHQHTENVGQPLRDHVVVCLTKLVVECCKLLRQANALPPSPGFIEEIISRFLFPPLSETGSSAEPSQLPVLDAVARENLYGLLLMLCQGPEDISVIVSKLNDDLLPADFFEPNFGHDRQALRTEVGYAGLRNLSNTCYLNSLFSQLFMNVQFREFLFNANVLDESRQRLLLELGKVFAYMQNSYEKSVDPSSAVEAITTYEGEQIDVSVQMDVDEFFNLLFDRLEGQIADPQAREFFKSMYGGHLVQQVKSKECEHISERLEPFSAVQMEIKGKVRLEDSLNAYVDGEVLQGENKYSCTSCGRHVDAVKRACLKDVPDNLIFNLKRFDYDIMNGTRTKVNDEFHFPDTIDIAPYTLDHLSDTGRATHRDMFELTGVIVHSGTADSGHYYSFIRQRPSVKDKQHCWVQFNDQDVTVFDVNQLQDACFGGTAGEGSFFGMPKFYNAYMLFYQRTSSIQRTEQQYMQHDAINPVRLSLPFEMEQHISQQNEIFLRSYCLQDPTHATFVRQLLERMRVGREQEEEGGDCTTDDDHLLERQMLEMVLEYLRQVSSRWKEVPSFEETISLLTRYAERCTECAKIITYWYTGNKVIGDVIVMNPYPVVRKGFSTLLQACLLHLNQAKAAVGTEEADPVGLPKCYEKYLQACLAHLSKLWDIVTKSGRCWNEYFGVLNFIVKLGPDEVTFTLDEDFLGKCIDIVMIHLNKPAEFPITKRLRARYTFYLNARDRNRPFPHPILIRFLVNMLTRVDYHQQSSGDYRAEADKKASLTVSELEILGLERMPYNLEWLRRLIAGRQNPNAGDLLVAHLAADRKLAGVVSATIAKGLNDRMVNIAVSFLTAVLAFCESCRSENQISDLVQIALEGIGTIGLDYGKEYFDFVLALLKTENQNIGAERGFLDETVLQYVQHWAPPFLLSPNEIQHDVRGDTIDLLRQMLFQPLQQAEAQDPHQYRVLRSYVQELAVAAHSYAQNTFLNPRSRDYANLQPGQVSQLIDVVEHSLQYFEIDNPIQEEKVSEIQNTMAALRARAEVAVETLSTAEWQEGSSDMAEPSGAEEYDDLSP